MRRASGLQRVIFGSYDRARHLRDRAPALRRRPHARQRAARRHAERRARTTCTTTSRTPTRRARSTGASPPCSSASARSTRCAICSPRCWRTGGARAARARDDGHRPERAARARDRGAPAGRARDDAHRGARGDAGPPRAHAERVRLRAPAAAEPLLHARLGDERRPARARRLDALRRSVAGRADHEGALPLPPAAAERGDPLRRLASSAG